MSLAWLKCALNRHDLAAALDRAQAAMEITRGDPAREPEALYWAAVVRYKASGDPKNLIESWNRLLDAFPESEWARRAEFIRD